MFRGVDINFLEWSPKDSKYKGGFRKPILEFTCLQEKMKTLNQTEYDVPDQVANIEQISLGSSELKEVVIKTKRDIQREAKFEAEASLNVPSSDDTPFSAAGAKGASMTFRKQKKIDTKTFKHRVHAKIFTHNVYVSPKLSTYAKIDINMTLFEKYIRNPKPYMDFIKNYGTHYITFGRLGGNLIMEHEISSELKNSMDMYEIQAYARGSFQETAGKSFGGSADWKLNKSTQNKNVEFEKNSVFTLKYYGGDSKLPTNSDEIDMWAPKVVENPWLLFGKLSPIPELIEDRLVRKSLEKAIEDYNRNRYLDGSHYFVKGEKCSDLLEKIDAMRKIDNPLKKDVRNLVSEIDGCMEKKLSDWIPYTAEDDCDTFFKMVPEIRVKWSESKKNCEKHGGKLVTPHDREENIFIQQKITNRTYYLGIVNENKIWKYVENCDGRRYCPKEPLKWSSWKNSTGPDQAVESVYAEKNSHEWIGTTDVSFRAEVTVCEKREQKINVFIETAHTTNAGTDGDVFLMIKDIFGRDSEWMELDTPGHDDFERNQIDEFKLTIKGLGEAFIIGVRIKNENHYYGWKSKKIRIQHPPYLTEIVFWLDGDFWWDSGDERFFLRQIHCQDTQPCWDKFKTALGDHCWSGAYHCDEERRNFGVN